MLPGTPQIIPFLKNCHIFARLSEGDLAFIAEDMEAVRFEGNQKIFEQGEDATDFYFIYDGRVQISRVRRQNSEEDELIGFLNEGDYFGREVLQHYGTHQVSAKAVSDCILLRLSGAHFNRVVEGHPELIPRLKMILESYHFGLQVKLPWVNPEEYIYYVARKHPFIMVFKMIPLFIGLLVLTGILLGLASTGMSLFMVILALVWLIGLVWGVLLYVDWNNDYYVITNRRVVFQERIVLFYDSRQESPLEQVQSTVTRSGWWGRRIGFGDVAIRTYTGEIMFHAVASQQDVADIIEEHRRRAQSVMRQEELRTMDETIARKIGVLPPAEAAAPKVAEAVRTPSRVQRFVNTIFRLRYQDGDKITYRTHWFILMKRIWFQTLSFLLVSGVALYITVRGPSLAGLPVIGILFALLVLWLVILLWWIYIYYDWHHDEYIITNDQVSDINKKPLGKEEKRTAPMKNILSIEYRRLGIIGLMLNYGTVFIRVGTETFTFDDVFDPAEVQRELFQRLAKLQLREKVAQAESERQRMTDWLAAYHRVTHR